MLVDSIKYSDILLKKLQPAADRVTRDQKADLPADPDVVVCFGPDRSQNTAANVENYDRLGRCIKLLQHTSPDGARPIACHNINKLYPEPKHLLKYAEQYPIVAKTIDVYQNWNNQQSADVVPTMETFKKFLNDNPPIHKRVHQHMHFFRQMFMAMQAGTVELNDFTGAPTA